MSLFNFFSPSPDSTNPVNTIDQGREAFKFFHNHAARYDGYNNRTMAQALLEVSANGHSQSDQKVTIFLDGLGTAIANIEQDGILNAGLVQQSMENLADKGQGQLPTSSSFFKAISDSSSEPSFLTTVVAIAPAVVSETASKAASAAVDVGNSVAATGKILTMLLPVVVVGALGFILFKRTKQVAG